MDTTYNDSRNRIETAASGGPHYTVRVTRPDGSRTYKGRGLRPSQAASEAAAWVNLHQGYEVDVVSERDPAVRADIAAWKKAITNAYRYFPA